MPSSITCVMILSLQLCLIPKVHQQLRCYHENAKLDRVCGGTFTTAVSLSAQHINSSEYLHNSVVMVFRQSSVKRYGWLSAATRTVPILFLNRVITCRQTRSLKKRQHCGYWYKWLIYNAVSLHISTSNISRRCWKLFIVGWTPCHGL